MQTTATSGWNAGACSRPRSSRRALEVVGVVFAFFYFWPLAAAYVAWKLLGYPGLADVREFASRGFDAPFRDLRFAGSRAAGFASTFSSTGNLAFDEYRRGEIDRLERERRRLDDEAREFRTFVEDLKRAKDREEFDAYMARRRQAGPTDV